MKDMLNFKIDLVCSNTTFISTYIGTTPVVSNASSVTTTLNDNTLTSEVNYNVTNSGTTNVSITYTVNDDNDGNIKNYYSNNRPTFSFVVRSK